MCIFIFNGSLEWIHSLVFNSDGNLVTRELSLIFEGLEGHDGVCKSKII